MKYSCDIIKDLMPLYADNICSEESRAAVDEHCLECLDCRVRLNDMLAEIPHKDNTKKPAGFVNPIKKIVGKRVRFLISAFLICSLIAAVCVKAVILTTNENYYTGGESWSTIKAERYIKKFAKTFKSGKYLDALETVDILTNDYASLTDEEQDAIYEEYAKACERFFSLYPILSYSTKCETVTFTSSGNSKGTINARITYNVKSPNNNPVYAVFDFIIYRAEEGLEYNLNSTFIESDNFHGYSGENLSRYGMDLNNITVSFPELDFTKNGVFASRFGSFLEDEDYYGASFYLYTHEKQDIIDRGSADAVFEYINNRSYSYYYSPDRFRLMEGFGFEKEIEDIEKNLETVLRTLFSEKYKFVSLEYDAPYYSDETLFKGFGINQHGAFKQNIKINMRSENEEFSVSFSVLLYDWSAVLPAQNITYSENTPEAFKKDFEDIFTK